MYAYHNNLRATHPAASVVGLAAGPQAGLVLPAELNGGSTSGAIYDGGTWSSGGFAIPAMAFCRVAGRTGAGASPSDDLDRGRLALDLVGAD